MQETDMKSKLLLIALLLNAVSATAATPKEICKEHTQSSKSYNICVEHATKQEQLGTCADITLHPENTFKTGPFKSCLKISEARKLPVASVKNCGDTSGTHVGFTRCLSKVEVNDGTIH
jgi:hypothetical protein